METLRYLCLFGLVLAVGGADIIQIIAQCTTESKASPADIQTFMRRDIPKSKEGKCMMACVLKKNDAMTDDGKLSTEGMRTAVDSMAKKYTVKKDIVEKVHQAMVKCTKNVGSTTDDCETAYKFANCFKDEANAKGLMPRGQGAF